MKMTNILICCPISELKYHSRVKSSRNTIALTDVGRAILGLRSDKSPVRMNLEKAPDSHIKRDKIRKLIRSPNWTSASRLREHKIWAN